MLSGLQSVSWKAVLVTWDTNRHMKKRLKARPNIQTADRALHAAPPCPSGPLPFRRMSAARQDQMKIERNHNK